MDLLDRLLGHDTWTTRQLLDTCDRLDDEQIDTEFDIGHRTIRATFQHIIYNMEIWSLLMAGEPISENENNSISELLKRLDKASSRLARVSQQVAKSNAWDDLWTDYLDKPPTKKSFGSGIAHIITHSMHHRAQILNMLRRLGMNPVPEGDIFSWENRLREQQR